MQHMFSFKARHYLPAFLLASAFPRELRMSSHWQCSVLAITLENQESGLLLKFQQPEWMPALSWLQKLPVPWSLALAKPAGGVDSCQTPLFKSHVHMAQLSFCWSHRVAQGGVQEGATSPKPDRTVTILFSLLPSRKASKTQQGVTAPKTLGLRCAKLLSPVICSPLDSLQNARS